MGEKMAGTNEFAFFRCKSICTGGGVQNQAEKNSKNAFRPVPVQKLTFPESQIASDLKSRSPNRKNFPQTLSLSWAAQIALSNRAICDLSLCSNRR